MPFLSNPTRYKKPSRADCVKESLEIDVLGSKRLREILSGGQKEPGIGTHTTS